MNIRQFAQLCRRTAAGEDCATDMPKDRSALTMLAGMAKDHRVLPLLALALGQKASQQAAIPHLLTPLHHTTRNMKIKAQLLELDGALAGSGKQMILMKGAVNLFAPIYPSLGARHMADIDLLLPDADSGAVFERLGYQRKDPAYEDRIDAQGNPVLHLGGLHLSPVIRAGDLVTIEPHLLAVMPKASHLLPRHLATDLRDVPGCAQLKQPSAVNHLIVSLIHTLKHDRDTLDGALLIRGLVECDMLFDRLTEGERLAVRQHFAGHGGKQMFAAWRALADWLFHNDEAAATRSLAAWLLITEFRLRARGYRAVFAISVLHRVLAPLHFRYWTSLTFVSHARRLVRRDFWARFFHRLGRAYKD